MTGQTSAMMALRDPDIRLMLRVRDADDRAAFAELVDRFQHRLVTVLTHLVGYPHEAEDLAQEVFLRVYRTRAAYTPKAKFATWLFTIANNLALNALRDRKRKPVRPLDPAGDPSASGPWSAEGLTADPSAPAPGQRLQQEELAAVVRRAVDGLNDRQRMAIVLNKFEDMNYTEIAAVMGLTTKAVKSLLARARERLRECLTPYVELDGPLPPPASDPDPDPEG
jgi:RNA polymerase sigma-70 factor (ECF subfamily)